MLSRRRMMIAAIAAVMGAGHSAGAQTAPERSRLQDQTRSQERIYRGEMMSEQEREQYRERLRNARTEEERARIRNEHRTQMDARTRARKSPQGQSPKPSAPRSGGAGRIGGSGGGGGGRR